MLPDGRFGVVCYFRDISAQVHAREALREADRRKDEFLATLSHELRNPLAPLRNALQVLRVAERETSAATPIHEMMERQVNHLVRLVDDLLEMSRISRGTLELRKERLDVAAIIENALETSDPLIGAAGHRVTVIVPPERVWIDGDPVRLAQVFSNLLNNAAKYTAPGGEITVTVRTQDRTVLIRVRDTGVGIGPEALPRVFDLFHRGDHMGQGTGLGIGLTIARRIAELHGGTITAHSAGPGSGSEFTVELPIAATHGETAPAERRGSSRASLPQRVLIVDDNRDAAESLGLLLGMLGADVRVARDGPEALEIVKGYDPAVVLLDIGMPGMDGFEVARRIRAGSASRRPSIVALTGWGQPEDRRRTKEAGFDHHLVKPADMVALQGILSTIQP
jgi:CheY-like chemotaxis protein